MNGFSSVGQRIYHFPKDLYLSLLCESITYSYAKLSCTCLLSLGQHLSTLLQSLYGNYITGVFQEMVDIHFIHRPLSLIPVITSPNTSTKMLKILWGILISLNFPVYSHGTSLTYSCYLNKPY